ncbi:hypothetical protein KR084_004865, partial [Drosophila pseudotakahashii]
MMKLLNDVLRPVEGRLQPLQESEDRQGSLFSRPTGPEVAPAAAEVHQRQESDRGIRRPPELPPRQRPRPLVNESPGVESSQSQEPEYPPAGRNDRNARQWRVEDRRAADFRDEPRLYANSGAGNGNRWIRVDRWNVSFDGEDDRNSVDDFVFRLEFLQRQHQCPWNEVLRNFHALLSGRAREWYWVHVRQARVDTWNKLRRALMDRFRGHQTE